MKKVKVYVTAGDGVGWAFDTDRKITSAALELTGVVELVPLEEADAVHAIWWDSLVPPPFPGSAIPDSLLLGKWIICQTPNRPFHLFSLPRNRLMRPRVGRWLAGSTEARREMDALGLEYVSVPYAIIDTAIFKPLPKEGSRLAELRRKWSIPEDRYLIGNFQRDTEGRDCASPKIQKGPDVFMEILRCLVQRGAPVHPVLAGPRRFWIRKQLDDAKISYTYIGRDQPESDDISFNILSKDQLNLLYNIVDLSLVTSRWEGGPHAIPEAAAAGCKVLSTPVGVAEDILEPACVYHTVWQAADRIETDISTGSLEHTKSIQSDRVQENHTPEGIAPRLRDLYASLENIPVFSAAADTASPLHQNRSAKKTGRLARAINFRRKPLVCLVHKFVKPPYGGGNQFIMALRKMLKKNGVRVTGDMHAKGVSAYLVNSVHFDRKEFKKISAKWDRPNVLHRIDGPIHLYRGQDRELDDLCFEINREFASATVLQSAWSFERLVELGYRSVSPTIIHNAVDPTIFNPRGRTPFDRKRKIRLVSTSWSSNPRKGGATYKWLDENLDWSRFEYTFVGNSDQEFENIRQTPAVPSEGVAKALRAHDIYIFASRVDPCSNAVIEALSCGLPVLYFNGGGTGEVVGHGGASFENDEDLPGLLDHMVENHEIFQRLIQAPRMDDVAAKYLEILRHMGVFD